MKKRVSRYEFDRSHYSEADRRSLVNWANGYDWQYFVTLRPSARLKFGPAEKQLANWSRHLEQNTGFELAHTGVYSTHNGVHIHILASGWDSRGRSLHDLNDNDWGLLRRGMFKNTVAERVYDRPGICDYVFGVNLNHRDAQFLDPYGDLSRFKQANA